MFSFLKILTCTTPHIHHFGTPRHFCWLHQDPMRSCSVDNGSIQ